MPKLLSALLVAGVAGLAATAAGSAASARPAAAEEKNIVETAVAAGSFTTLVALVEQAGLVDALSGDGKLTVFAPTDEAFAKLPQATLDELARKPRKLRRVLKYHVVGRELKAADVVERRS